MKRNTIITTLVVACTLLSSSCTEDMQYNDTQVTATQGLLLPKAGQTVELQSSASASVLFEWASALAEDGCSPQYEVLFYKAGDTTGKPIYQLTSDDTGFRTYATVTHKTLDKIAQLAGLGSGETGQLEWTVASTRGISQAIATERRSLTITRLLGFAEIPTQVFVTGDASEAANDPGKAIAMTATASGEYEAFTQLQAGKTYYFISSKTDDARIFYIEDGKLKESSSGDITTTVAQTGIYRINLDFNISTATLSRVVSLGWFFCPENQVMINLDYQGGGIWKGTGTTEFYQFSWGRDQRYKFEMILDKDGTQTTVHWGPTNASLDSAPSDNEAASYYYMTEYEPTQWDYKWKLQNKFDGANTTFTIYLNADSPYHHTVEPAN